MTGHLCPECGTPRDTEGRAGPGCVCAERAEGAARAERGAETAATGVFDPLRVRPYVTLRNQAAGVAAPGGGTVLGAGPVPGGEMMPGGGTVPGGETMPLPRLDAVDPPGRPAPYDEPTTLGPVDLTPVRHRGRPRPRSHKGLMVVAAAVTVAGTAAFASGLFSGDDEREKALPDRGTSAPTVSALPDIPTSSPTLSASADASASPSGTASAGSSALRSGDSSAPAGASTQPPSTGRATGSVSEAPQAPGSGTLRSGDSGPGVVDLQQRLAELSLYAGPADGQYGQSVENAVRTFQDSWNVKGDPKGVYGPKTRRALEAQTGQA
ncbi:peptidoglycan-binding protein [Streptomyces sp. ISL-1]|uniref:peptidoglycan-binding domain-containing protein n=1 Tax=Streptomyces sp. ISL-1 TaxID=2817657 RepID=UPI001BECD38B|nr:peptidoglycan-binding domain-containing protein [Streptomyces sp. ISL-1]MBT2390776.1 peptidoglycan-binding protein [Streptomyces sp. ISL-1]